MIYFVHNGCYWITSAIDKNYSNIFVLKCVQDKKGEGFIPFKKKFDWNSIGDVRLKNSFWILTF